MLFLLVRGSVGYPSIFVYIAIERYYASHTKTMYTKEKVRAKILQAIGPDADLTIVKRRKLQWYGRVSRSSGLAKTNLARHCERGKKTRQTEKEVGKTLGNEEA